MVVWKDRRSCDLIWKGISCCQCQCLDICSMVFSFDGADRASFLESGGPHLEEGHR